MSKYIDADLLSAEIKRLKQDNTISDDKEYAQYELDVACGYDMALEKVFLILNSLPEQPVEGLEEEIERYCGPYNKRLVPDFIETVARHFAEWQKVQDQKTIELAEDHAMLAGMNKMEQQIVSIIESRIKEIIGDAQPNPVLRIELQGIIDKIK